MKKPYGWIGVPGMFVGSILFLLTILAGVFRFKVDPFIDRGSMSLLTLQFGVWIGVIGLVFFFRHAIGIFALGGILLLMLVLSVFEQGDSHTKQQILALIYWGLCWIPSLSRKVIGQS
ncbi:MAG TPA: hypothetical protein DCX07_02495 [Phycisphaerales bacterium]|nr:hypothetical protein [Phycisphaerales bacterium]